MLCIGILLFMWCQQPTPAATSGALYCNVAKPIGWSAKDTRRTKEDIDTENAKWKRLCRTNKK